MSQPSIFFCTKPSIRSTCLNDKNNIFVSLGLLIQLNFCFRSLLVSESCSMVDSVTSNSSVSPFFLYCSKSQLYFRVELYGSVALLGERTYVVANPSVVRLWCLCAVLYVITSGVARNLIFFWGGGVYVYSHCNFKTCVNVPHVNKTVTDFGGIYIPIYPPRRYSPGGWTFRQYFLHRL